MSLRSSLFCRNASRFGILFAILAAISSQSKADTTLIRNVNVFDGNTLHESGNVLIRDGKIVDANFKGATPKDAKEVGCQSCTLLPGLIDSHVHAYANRKLSVLAGVTTELDMFMNIDQMHDIKARMKRGELDDEADLFSAGTLVTAPGGHGTEYGFPIPTISGPEEADAFVKARIDEGSDYIKLVYDDGKTFRMKFPTIDKSTMQAVIAAAHKYRKLAVVHIGSQSGARDAIDAGADGLVHLFPGEDGGVDFARFASAHHVFIVPTWTVYEGLFGRSAATSLLANENLSGIVDETQINILKSKWSPIDASVRLDSNFKSNISALRAAGVPLLAGTDAGNRGTLPGLSIHRELELLVQGGLTPAEALTAATATPAKLFALNDRGQIANGLKADLLLVKGDPTRNILATRDIVEVWKDGKPVSAFRALRVAAVKKLNQPKPQIATNALPADGRILNINGSGKFTAPFGLGWDASTDASIGGKSIATLSASADSLKINGEVRRGSPGPVWSGAVFFPGKAPYEAFNLGAANAIRFKVRGDGSNYSLLAYSKSSGYMPAYTGFSTSGEWTEITVPFSALAGFKAEEASAIAFVAFGRVGNYSFEIKDVQLVQPMNTASK